MAALAYIQFELMVSSVLGTSHGQHHDQPVAPAQPQVMKAHNQPAPAHDGDVQTPQEVEALPTQTP